MDMSQMMNQIESEQASPEEEAQYEKALEVAMQSIHTGKVAQKTVGRVLNAKELHEGVAEAAFVILRRVEVALKGIEDSVKVQLGEDIIMEILGLLIDSDRLQEGEVTDELMEKIVTTLYMRYTQDAEQRGVLDTDAIKEDLGQVQGANAMSNQEVQARGLMNV